MCFREQKQSTLSISLIIELISIFQKKGSITKEKYTLVIAKTETSVREISNSFCLDDVDNSIYGYMFMKKPEE